jgi:hypothetical protein
MPNPSYWPIFTALGVLVLAAGFLIEFPWPYIKFPVPFIGGAIAFIGVVGWSLEPAAPEAHHGSGAHH